MLRGSRTTHNAAVEKPLLAGEFEECCDQMQRLYMACCNLRQTVCQIDTSSIKEMFAALKTWGADTEVPFLDHRLRMSSELRKQTLELLTALKDDVKQGLDRVQMFESSRTISSAPSHQVYEFSLERQPDNHAVDFDSVLDHLEDLLDRSSLAINSLRRLAPELQDAHPTDLDDASCSSSISGSGESSLETFVEISRSLFPSASPIIHQRLGAASRKRGLYLKILHTRKDTAAFARTARRKGLKTPGLRKATRRDVAVDAFNFQQPELTEDSEGRSAVSPVPDQGATSYAPSAPPSTTNESEPVASIFTHPVSSRSSLPTARTTPAPSVAFRLKEDDLKEAAYSAKASFAAVKIPSFPRQLEESQPYHCQFCGFEINIYKDIKTPEDWEAHIYDDLFSYLCTFDECISARKTYGAKDEWFQHELLSHRISRAWVCEACKEEFSSKGDLKDHLLASHADDFSPAQANRFVALLRPSRSQKPFSRQRCPLCPAPLDPGDVKEHVADHLQTLALTSLAGEDTSESSDADDVMSQTGSDAMSDRGFKLRIIETFAQEQNLNLQKMPQPVQITEADDIPDYSDSEEAGGYASAGRGQAGSWRVQKLMASSSDRAPSRRDRASSSTKSDGPSIDLRLIPRDESFRGRKEELIKIYMILSEPGRVYVLSAEAGMGKTSVAVEFMYRHEQSFDAIFWVQAETRVGASDTFNQIALHLGLATAADERETLTQLGREFLETTSKRWLMVLDNAERWEDIEPFLPTKSAATAGSILITTRSPQFTAPTRPVNYYRSTLEELNKEEATELLLQGLPPELRPETDSTHDPEMRAATDIATLAGLPLAIVLISGYMKAMSSMPSEFRQYWSEWWLDQNHAIAKSGAVENSRTRLIQITDMVSQELSTDARAVLQIMAFFDSDGVQKELLTWVRDSETEQAGPSYLRPFRLRAVIKDLEAKNLITSRSNEGKEKYVMHRTLQVKLLNDLGADKSNKPNDLFKLAFKLVRYRLPRPSLTTPEPHKWNQFKEYLPQVASLQRVFAEHGRAMRLDPFVDLAALFKDGGVLLWQRFLSADAIRLLRTAEQILEQLDTVHDGLHSEIHITMNLLLQYLGISGRRESSERLKKILEFRQRQLQVAEENDSVTKNDRLGLVNASADYANSLLQFNWVREAEAIYRTCYDDLLTISSEKDDFFPFAKLTHHLAYCRMYHREFAEAKRLAAESMRLMAKMDDRQVVLRYQFDQACVILQSGDRLEALDLHERILAERVKWQGTESYFTLQSQYAVAAIYSYLGRWDEAEWQLRNTLTKVARAHGKVIWTDAAIARTKYHLSMVLIQKTGDKDLPEAEELARDSKDVLSRLLPHDPLKSVDEKDTLALFDHLQPVFGGRWTGESLFKYVAV